MGNKIIHGGEQPGVTRSDEHPWGLANIVMPIPVEFARKMRNDQNTISAYKRFLHNRVFQLIPTFINFNEKLVYSKFRSDALETISLVKWDERSNIDGSGNGPIINMLTNKTRTDRLLHLHGFKSLFYYPNILSNLSDDVRAAINKQISFTCRFTDEVHVAAIILAETKSADAPIDTKLIHDTIHNGNTEAKKIAFNFIAQQNAKLSFNDLSSNYLTMDNRDHVLILKQCLETAQNRFDSNEKILDHIKNSGLSRYIINVSYRLYTQYGQGSHITTVIIDTKSKLFYILDSNGVHSCELNIFQYFTHRLKWGYDEYTMVPIMPITSNETPRAFQAISRGGFCQTWNIFNQELVIANDVGADINNIIYNKIFNYVDPIIGDVNYICPERALQVKITLIMLEFMFYIYYELCSEEFRTWFKDFSDFDTVYAEYILTEEYNTNLTQQKLVYNMTRPTGMSLGEFIRSVTKRAEDDCKSEYYQSWLTDKNIIHDNSYKLNLATNEFISAIFPGYELTAELSTDDFIKNLLKEI